MTGIIGKKLGMTQVYIEGGVIVPVTVIEAKPGVVIEVKTQTKHGYEALKVGFFDNAKDKHLSKAEAGVYKKAGLGQHRKMHEFRAMAGKAVGEAVTLEGFQKGDKVSVIGISKGKGFQGVVKRHHFNGGPRSHGAMNLREPGSIGASTFPSRVFKGQRMGGHMGSDRVTVQNLTVVDVRPEQNLILIKGAVPGGKNTVVEIRKEG